MDGKSCLYYLRQLLSELSDSSFLDERTSYEYLWEAAKVFASRTGVLRSTQSITTVADQAAYTLNADFENLYLRDAYSDFVVKYNDGTNNIWPKWKPYEEIITEDNTTSVDYPDNFTVFDAPTLSAQISSTTTSAGAATGGLCNLTDTASSFSNVEAGDAVHNNTDGSDGYVVSKTSTTVLVVALFGGTNNDITSGDAYVIQPQGRLQLQLSPPPSTAGRTVTVYYLQKPLPVFSSYGIYRFSEQFMNVIIKYAAWLYKYRDTDPNFGDKWYNMFDMEVRRANKVLNASSKKDNFSVSFRKR